MEGDQPYLDLALQMFVNTMAKVDMQLSVTLLVGGSWICGTLITPRMYMEETAAQLTDKAGDMGTAVGVFFKTFGQMMFPADAEIEAGAAPAPDDGGPWHLHLRDARSVTTQGSIPTDRFYLRIRMRDVAAWSIGEMSLPGHRVQPPPRLGR